ncbi:Apoptosis-inducing factor 1 [Mactra antiquata]
MWCKNIRRLTSSRLTCTGVVKVSRCQCLVCGNCTQARVIHSCEEKHYGGERSRTHNNARNTSKSYLKTIAGLGTSIAAYTLWMRSKLVYAEEQSSEQSSLEKPSSENTESTSKTETNQSSSETQEDVEEEINWSQVADVPSYVPYLLIGGGVASLEAFKAIKTKEPNAKVLMVGDEDYIPYDRTSLSKEYLVKRFWMNEDNKEMERKDTENMDWITMSKGLYMEAKKLPYSDRGGLGILKGRKVLSLDVTNKTVTLDNGSTIRFDKCLIATGGKPKNDTVLSVAEDEVKNRTTLFRNYDDLNRLNESIKKCQSVAVIGGGFLGSELSIDLLYKGVNTNLQVYQIFPEKGNMAKVLPDYLSEWITNKMKRVGVDVITETRLEAAQFEDGKVSLKLSNGKVITVDHVVVAVGIQPNTDLADSAQLELDDKYGGFRVNTELQARSDIWAAGDCACFYDAKLGRRRVEHQDHAMITGRLAGFNMAGEKNAYTHQSMFWSTIPGVNEYEAVGLSDSRLQTFSVFRKKYPSEDDSKKDVEPSEDSNKSTKDSLQSKQESTKNNSDKDLSMCSLEDDYNYGIIFYLRNNEVVGIVLWNLLGYSSVSDRLNIARQVIASGVKDQDLTEVAKLFNIYAK